MKSKPLTTISFFASLTIAILTGCNTTNTSLGPEISAMPDLDIVKGSTTEEVIALLGAPARIQKHEDGIVTIETWEYEIKKKQTDMVAFETEEIPYVDPITGEERTIEEPLYKPQTTTYTQFINIYVVEDKVIGWKVNNKENRDLHL